MRRTKIVLASLLALSALSVKAQDAAVAAETKATPTRPFLEQHPIAISAHLGTQGIGLEGKMMLDSNWSVRVGASFLPLKYKETKVLGDVTADDERNHNWTNVHLLAEFHTPFWKSVDFRFVAGAAYFTTAKVTAHYVASGTYYYGQIPLEGSEMGYVNVESDWKGIAPYAGAAISKTLPNTRFNLSLDLGTYYLPKPKVTMEATGNLSGNEANQPTVEENMKNYRWLPVVQLSLNYKL